MVLPKWTTPVALVLTPILIVGALFVGLARPAPGPELVSVDGGEYFYDAVSLSLPLCRETGNITSSEFRGVMFNLRITAWCSSEGGALNGTASESSGLEFVFSIPGISGPTSYVTWISADRYCGVEWDRNSAAILLVAADV
jgi:hypothetical protein